MKKFYLNDTEHELQVEISPTLVETLDESLDNMTISLKINKEDKPYAPILNKVIVGEENEGNVEIINEFVISSDTVELVSQNPLRYKHTLSLIQKSQFLTKHLIRNTVFSNNVKVKSNIASRSLFGKLFYHPTQTGNNGMLAGFDDLGSGTEVIIDLSKNKIDALRCKVSFMIQYTYEMGESGGGSVELYWRVFLKKKKPKLWSDIFSKGYLPQVYGEYLPTLTFSIGSRTLRYQIKSSDVINGEYFIFPQEVINWINESSSGNLTIFIAPYGIGPDSFFIPASAFTGLDAVEAQTPLFANIKFEFDIQIVENSIYQIIDTLLKQYRKDTTLYHDAIDLFKMPDDSTPTRSALKELLETTQAPNFVFTQSSMFDALSEIFRIFDATFRIDKDGYLEIEYFNEYGTQENKINFVNSMKAGRNSALGEERYANRLVTFFQNTKINDKFPNSNDETVMAYVRSKTLGVPGQSDYVLMVQKPIDLIKKIKIRGSFNFVNSYRYYSSNGYPINYNFEKSYLTELDITNYVIESEVYSILPNDVMLPINNDYKNVGKNNCLTYKRGDNYIDVSGYYNGIDQTQNQIINNVVKSALMTEIGIVSTENYAIIIPPIINWDSVQFSVEYIALVDGKLVNESIDNKYDGEILTNQNNGSIDINKLGLNMVGLSLKLGQPTLTMTQKFTSWKKRIKKGNWFIDSTDNSRWVANNCSYTLITNDKVQATIEFVKNFNSLASRIELNREKRLTNISNELTIKCEENYGEFVYYSDYNIDATAEQIALNGEFLKNSILMGFGATIESQNISTTFNAASKTVTTTIANFNADDYTKKQIVILNGTVVGDPQQDNPNGTLTLESNGNQIVIPLSTAVQSALRYNTITQTFDFDYSVLETYPFNSTQPTSLISEGEELQVGIIVSNGSIEGAIILSDLDVGGLTWFNPFRMIEYYPNNDYKIEYALITAYKEDDSIISLETTGQVKNISIPMVVYGSGNSVCFEMSFESPISAGNQLLDNYTSEIWQGGWFSRAVLYTNENGEATKFTIDFVKMQEPLTRYFPAMKKDDNNSFLSTFSFGKLDKFAYYKKPNEIFALNYQLHFLPYISNGRKECFLSNEYIKNNAFAEGINNRKLHIVYTLKSEKEFEYSILDTKGENDHSVDCNVTYVQTSNLQLQIIIETNLSDETLLDIGSWALVDYNNNIYFASNNTPGLSGFQIYFIWRHHRI